MNTHTHTGKSSSIIHIAILIVFLIAGFCLYKPVLNHSYSEYDDKGLLVDNEFINQGFSLEGFKWAFSFNDRIATYLPVTWFSHMIDFELFGTDFTKHHAASIGLHSVNAFLVYFFVLFISGNCRFLAFTTGFLFLIHPLHVESVAWIVGRKDLLATFFGLISLYMYFIFMKNSSIKFYIFSVACFILSMASKEVLLFAPFLLILCDIWFNPDLKDTWFKKIWTLLLNKIPFFTASLVFALIGMHGAKTMGINANQQFALHQRLLNVFINLKDYLMDTFYPSSLCIYYPITAHSSLEYVMAILLILILTSVACILYKRMPLITFSWFFFVTCLLPFLGIYQISQQARADRYIYTALMGPLVICLYLCLDFAKVSKIFKIFFLTTLTVFMAFCVYTSTRQIALWKNDITLFKHCIKHTERNAFAHEKLGIIYFEKKDYAQALQSIEAALRITAYGIRYSMLGNIYEALEQYDKAEEAYKKSLKYRIVSDDTFVLLTSLQFKLEKTEEGLKTAEEGLSKIKDDKYLNNMGGLLDSLGFKDKAKLFYQKTLETNPNLIEANFNLAFIYFDEEQFDKAIEHLHICLKNNPTHQDSLEALRWMTHTIENVAKTT